MTNGELQKYLQRFPPEGVVQIRIGAGTPHPVVRAEMLIDPAPLVLQEQNVGWTDLIKDRVGIVLVAEGAMPKLPTVDEIALGSNRK